MRVSLVAIAVAVAAALAACGGDNGPGPHIDRLAPEQAVVGEEIDILGSKFCPGMVVAPADAAAGTADAAITSSDDAGTHWLAADVSCAASVNGFVTFGSAPGIDPAAPDGGALAQGRITQWTATRISVTVPQLPPGQISVIVTANGVPSNAMDFEVLP